MPRIRRYVNKKENARLLTDSETNAKVKFYLDKLAKSTGTWFGSFWFFPNINIMLIIVHKSNHLGSNAS